MRIVNTFLAYVFPKRDEYERVMALDVCDVKAKYDPVTVKDSSCLSSFSDPDIRACIHEIKYHDTEKAAQLLAVLLNTWLLASTRPYVIVPIPLSKKRHRERGYNQVIRVLKQARSNNHTLTYYENILTRHKHTAPQTTLNKADRQQNIKDAFMVSRHIDIGAYRYIHFVILDDVMTTGATLAAAKAALEQLQPASITTLALAH